MEIPTRHGKAFHIIGNETHQEFLKECILNTEGDILELGCSDGSTGFILNLIKGTNRKLRTLTTDVDKYKITSIKYPQDEQHEWRFSHDNWELLFDLEKENEYSVIFVDSYPWSSRKKAVDLLHSNCEYMVIHDAKLLLDGKFIQPHKYFCDLELCFPLPPYPLDDCCCSTLVCHKPKFNK